MDSDDWGLLAPETLPSNRRSRNLGLGRSVRQFNELAVPGLAGLRFGRQVLLTTLAMVLVRRTDAALRYEHIPMANALEAVACCLAYRSNGWTADPRLRGRQKLRGVTSPPSFGAARRAGFHVSQPMRMSTAQALPSLGFATTESVRFNAFQSTQSAHDFVTSCVGDLKVGNNSPLLAHLQAWVAGQKLSWESAGVLQALSPLRELPEDGKRRLRYALLEGAHLPAELLQRRQGAWRWVKRLRGAPSQVEVLGEVTPPAELDAMHWHDLRAGAQLAKVRDAAIAVLDAVETTLHTRQGGRSLPLQGTLPKQINTQLHALSQHAVAFLALEHTDIEANIFCRQCVAADADTLRALLLRDGQVLRLVNDCARPGPGYSGTPAREHVPEQGDDEDAGWEDLTLPLPPGISYRVRNLCLLQMDLEGVLGPWLSRRTGTAARAGAI